MNIKYQRKKILDYYKCKYRHLINFLDSWLIFDLMKTMVVHRGMSQLNISIDKCRNIKTLFVYTDEFFSLFKSKSLNVT